MTADSTPSSLAARHLNVSAFARSGEILSGQQPLTDFPRLAQEHSGEDTPPVHWHIRGEAIPSAGGADEIWLHVQADVELGVQCQRCLESMQLPVHVQRSFRCVADEATAARLDEEIEADVLAACGAAFDALELVEDELLMALPVAPHHATCQQPLAMQVQTADFDAAQQQRPHPFAALAALQKKNSAD